jgi:RNA polymerase sigma factor, sigma-70 family
MSMNRDAVKPPDAGVQHLTEHLFRRESGKLVSMLTGIFGIERLQLAEDVVQEAMIRALQTWPYYGTPKNPAAWLMQTAKNLALDVIRREKRFHEKQPEISASFDAWNERDEASPRFDEEITNDRLRLMFACCHPDIPPESQAALALKTLCGFSPAEIAAAFLSSEAAITKRLTRARQRIQEQGIRFEIPAGPELAVRVNGVLHILYLLFNEGYKASSGDSLVREDLCQEAIRLTELVAGHPATTCPRAHALAALMWLNAARLSSRIDDAGNILRLQDQDRSTWNRGMIARGLEHLAKGAEGDEVSEYHLQAGIAVCHCLARDYESTDWVRILALYDRWVAITDSPVVALNRAVAVANVSGPDAGLAAVEAIPAREQLDGYYLTHAVRGDFETRRGNHRKAAEHFRKALQLAELKSEQSFLARRLRDSESD